MSALHEALAASLAALAEVEGSCASYPCATSPVESPAASWAASESHEVRKFSKRPWTAEEDEMLRTLVEQHGPCRWPTIASQMNGRAAKQCRERWLYHLDKSVKKEDWTAEEDERLTQLIETHGPKWSHIKAYLPGRMDNAIKNRWSLILRAQRRTQAQAAEGASEVSARWTAAEDALLRAAVILHGHKWGLVAASLPGRTTRSVRTRWGRIPPIP